MKIERVISWFDKETEELIGEYSIDDISLEALTHIFMPPENDPLMYNPYCVDMEKGEKLSSFTGFEFNHNLYVYQVDCFQV